MQQQFDRIHSRFDTVESDISQLFRALAENEEKVDVHTYTMHILLTCSIHFTLFFFIKVSSDGDGSELQQHAATPTTIENVGDDSGMFACSCQSPLVCMACVHTSIYT